MTVPLAPGTYDNRFEPDSVYGHALDLLRRHRVEAPEDAIHLDIGCGYGRIAEILSESLGLTYVGVDADSSGLTSLAERGFETHQLLLEGAEETLARLRDAVGGRRLVSLSMLDTLEHLPDGMSTLRALSRLAAEHGALVVISVPNVAHADITSKLLLGRLDITDVGLLDHTHTRMFTAATLDAELRAAGLCKLDEKDTHRRWTEQHFPTEYPLLAEGTEIGALIRQLRADADPDHADVMQLVRICAPGPASAGHPWTKTYQPQQSPFLSVVIRTQGTRLHTLREALLALHGQTDRDIEILVVGHRLSQEAIKAVERVIDDQPWVMRRRTRMLRVDDGTRTRPLNIGFAAATGSYIAILDDDDIPFAHWVETFRVLHNEAPGRLLRASSVRQSVQNVTVQGHRGLRAVDTPKQVYPQRFDILEHLRVNHSPPVSVAFPRGAFHDLGLRFDEDLSTTEDWDYIMRVVLLTGAQSSAAVTSVYRWWETGHSSRSAHTQMEWDRNHQRILNKLDALPLLLPAGTAMRLRWLMDYYDQTVTVPPQEPRISAENAQLRDETARLSGENAQLRDETARLSGENAQLRDETARLSGENAQLRDETARLSGENAQLRDETARLSGENAQLRDETARLQQAIHTSFALRFARLMPAPLRTLVRWTMRMVWRAIGGRFIYRLMTDQH